jgi:uncharacterized membrane protein
MPARPPHPQDAAAQRHAKAHEIADKLLGRNYDALDERAQKVARHMASRTALARNVATDEEQPPTAGQRAADAVARFGGSWTFVGLFAAVMVLWVGLNAVLLLRHQVPFDPYPYILLNLFLSMLAAIQAPIILMSQNRQSEKDRAAAGHDYEVNLKAELQIMLLHDKIDTLREHQWAELLELQREQLRLLRQAVPGGNLSVAGEEDPGAAEDLHQRN